MLGVAAMLKFLHSLEGGRVVLRGDGAEYVSGARGGGHFL